MRRGLFVLIVIVSVLAIGCTEVEVVDLDVKSNKTINDTKYVPTLEKEHPASVIDEVSAEIIEGLCTEKVLLAIRQCKWIDGNNLGITIKNNGFKDVTMAFYLFMDDEQIGSYVNETTFISKEERTFSLPLTELEEQFGEIEKIHATPLLTEDGISTSCSNKKLPVLLRGCG